MFKETYPQIKAVCQLKSFESNLGDRLNHFGSIEVFTSLLKKLYVKFLIKQRRRMVKDVLQNKHFKKAATVGVFLKISQIISQKLFYMTTARSCFYPYISF